jgi:uncharacterized protein YndB with AHSA1/START domain
MRETMAETRGRYGTITEKPALIFVRELAHPIEDVWSAVTDPDRVVAWLPCPIDGDLTTVGSPLLFVFPGDAGVEDPSTGEVLLSDKPTRLAFSWEDEEIRIELQSLGENASRIGFTNVMPADSTPAAARTAAGWHVCLDALEEHLNTGERTPPSNSPTPRFRELYEAYLSDGVPGGAPIPGD